MWANKYVGIPFKANGRDETGLDCWGLARLIYKNEFNIQLPSFESDYTLDDDFRIQELVAQYKEGWSQKETPSSGDLILFRILGEEQHVGVVIDSTYFIHVRENSDTAVERLDSPKWQKRIIGFYEYTPNKTNIILNAAPHPLKTEKVTLPVPAGTTLQQVYNWLQEEYTTSPEIVRNVHILLNGVPIPKEKWADTCVLDGDSLEYRAVVGKTAARLILTLVVMYIAYKVAGPKAAELAGAKVGAAASTWTAGQMAAAMAASTAVQVVGMKLIDMVAPLRLGDQQDPGNTKAQYLFSGGANQTNRYGAIPVILGKVKMTPPVGANTFVDYERRSTSYLNMILLWGYGPLRFYEETFKIGNKALDSFYEVTTATIDGYGEPEAGTLKKFTELYPQDLEQIYLGNELTWEGSPDPNSVGAVVDPITGDYDEEQVDKNKQPKYISQAEYAQYTTTFTLSPGDSTTITLPSWLAAYGRDLVVQYEFSYQGS